MATESLPLKAVRRFAALDNLLVYAAYLILYLSSLVSGLVTGIRLKYRCRICKEPYTQRTALYYENSVVYGVWKCACDRKKLAKDNLMDLDLRNPLYKEQFQIELRRLEEQYLREQLVDRSIGFIMLKEKCTRYGVSA